MRKLFYFLIYLISCTTVAIIGYTLLHHEINGTDNNKNNQRSKYQQQENLMYDKLTQLGQGQGGEGGGGGDNGVGNDGDIVIGSQLSRSGNNIPFSTHPIEKPRITNIFENQRNIIGDGNGEGLRQSITHIFLEKYNEYNVKTRSLQDKIKRLTSANRIIGIDEDEAEQYRRFHKHTNKKVKSQSSGGGHSVGGGGVNDYAADSGNNHYQNVSTKNVHLFYSAPVNWYRGINTNITKITNINNLTNGINEFHDFNSISSLSIQNLNTIFYPMLGPYSISTKILELHFRNIHEMGIGVIIITWHPKKSLDLIKNIMNFAKKNYNQEISIGIEIDWYPGRTPETIRQQLELFHREFIWSHPSLYRVWVESKYKYLPMIYICQAGAGSTEEDWSNLLSIKGRNTIRNTILDSIFIGHVSTKKDTSLIRRGSFNGFYNRLPSNGATYTSTWKNWDLLKKTADKYHLIFIPTVGPGYNEHKKEPPTGGFRRHRSNGQYYGVAWRTAMTIHAQFISVSSYNDWTCGTQIEEAIPYGMVNNIGGRNGDGGGGGGGGGYFKDYQPTGPRKYLDLTRHWNMEYVQSKITKPITNCNEYFNNTIC